MSHDIYRDLHTACSARWGKPFHEGSGQGEVGVAWNVEGTKVSILHTWGDSMAFLIADGGPCAWVGSWAPEGEKVSTIPEAVQLVDDWVRPYVPG